MPAQIAFKNRTNVRSVIDLAWTRLHMALVATFSPTQAADRASRLFMTPPKYAHTTAERELLALGKGFTVDAPSARLSAWRFGDGDRPAVILSHGWGGRGAQFRRFVTPLVDAGFQVIAFDHAAHGYSEGHEASLVHFLRDLEAVANHLRTSGVQVAAVIGHSLGAAAIGAWLKRNPAPVRVVLIAPPSSVEKYSSHFARYVGLPERLRREMQKRIERRLQVPWSEFELPGAVAGIEAPALVIHDRADRDVPFASGLAVARAWSGARLVRTEGLGHRAILRDAGVIRDTVDFLADQVVFPLPPAKGAAASPAPIF